MAGVDNIVKEILQEAQSKADALVNEAKANAEEILKEAAAADEKMAQDCEQEARRTVSDLAERAKSQSSLQKRQSLLQAKQDIIDEVIQKAYDKLSTQDGNAYFAMAEKLIQKAVRPGKGEICFNEADLKRIPADFEERIRKIAAGCGSELSISEVPAKIRSGFILSYGGIEENCSLDAIFSEKRESLRDLVNATLW